jgi:hypothetical protein
VKSGSTQKPQAPGSLARYVRELRGKAARHIRFGMVPRRSVIEIWAHRGCGEACLVCGESVLANEFEIEVCFEPDPLLGEETPAYRFHHLCYSVWAAERVRLRQKDERPQTGKS